MDRDDILFHTGNPIGTRIVLAVLGLGIIVLPSWDLRPWTIPLPLGLGFWAIALGALLLGGTLLSGAFVPRTAIHAHPDGLELRWQTRRRGQRIEKRRILPAARLGAPEVHRSSGDATPDSYYVLIPRNDRLRRALTTQHFDTEAGAEALADRIRDALGHSDVGQ